MMAGSKQSSLTVAVVTFLVYSKYAIIVAFYYVIFRIPYLDDLLVKFFHSNGAVTSAESLKKSMGSFKGWLGQSRSAIIDALKTVQLHGPMHNSDLLTLNKKPCKLSEFMHGSRPLVVNFGSCT